METINKVEAITYIVFIAIFAYMMYSVLTGKRRGND